MARSRRLTGSAPDRDAPQRRDVPAFLHQPGPTAYHRLNPLTKAVLATTTGIAAVVVGGVVGPLLLLAAFVIAPAAAARVLGRLVRLALLLALPVAISALLVNVFFFPGGQAELLRIGPVVATGEGLTLAVELLARVMAMSGAVTLFYLTTRPGDLVLDLERRGLGRRVAFVANASVQTVPAMVERAAQITEAQRARGLDTEGGAWRRLRGVVPIVGPVILGSITEVEERAMALEARGFTLPGRRTLLWAPADSTAQSFARWALMAALLALGALRATGALP